MPGKNQIMNISEVSLNYRLKAGSLIYYNTSTTENLLLMDGNSALSYKASNVTRFHRFSKPLDPSALAFRNTGMW